ALREADHDIVDPRPVGLAQLVEPALRALAQLLLTPDDEEMRRLTCIERKGQAPVALAADVPVAHVLEPVLHAAAGRRRQPRHLRGGLHHLRAQLVHGDEPLVIDPEDDLLVAAPARRIAVGVLLGAEEEPAPLRASVDLGGRLPRLFSPWPGMPRA